jgi:DNA polymerase III delta subunit
MIYFLHGTDTDKGRKKAHEMIDALQKKKPNASFFKMSNENWSEAQLEEYASSMGLFEGKYIVFLDRLCEDKKIKDDFLSEIKKLGTSQNIFIVLEGKLDKASATKIEKNSEKTQEFSLPEKKKEEYNAFALADAVGKRDRKNAWMLYRKAIDKGEAPEALHGMMFWKIKTMILGGYPGAYTKEELYTLAERLITTYHDSRRGVHELETGVEAILLTF